MGRLLSIFRVCSLLVSVALPSIAAANSTTAPTEMRASTDAPRSGYHDMSAATKATQDDDTQNPAMLWVKGGEPLWNEIARDNGKSCASCHGAASTSMRGVAARHPAFHAQLKRPVNLQERINLCRSNRQGAKPFAFESQELLSLESYIALQSRGMPIQQPADAQLNPFRARGEQLFKQRMGQLDLSCAQCHDGNAGKRLAASPIPQGHPTAYPIYRLEWQTVGSLQRRLRNCMTGVRAEPYAYGSVELVELELYLASRAAGMLMESPGVRP